jgi:SprT protein
MPVESLAPSRQEQVIAATLACIRRSEQLYDRRFVPPLISFDLTGRIAGMYRVQRGQQQIRYNPYIFDKYFTDNLANTVPHEVAHFVVNALYGRRRVQPHGAEWRAVMQRLGAEPSVTCRYDLGGIPQRRQRRFEYNCGCNTHAMSAVRHNRVQSGRGRYLCRQCREVLVFSGTELDRVSSD